MQQDVTVGYDGDCLMCSRGMRFLAEHDRHRRLRFLKLQSIRGREMEARAGTGSLQTVLVEADGRVYARFDAVFRCLKALGGVWSMLAVLGKLLPARDWLYGWIAARRKRWFHKDVCELPSPALLERLIDGDRV